LYAVTRPPELATLPLHDAPPTCLAVMSFPGAAISLDPPAAGRRPARSPARDRAGLNTAGSCSPAAGIARRPGRRSHLGRCRRLYLADDFIGHVPQVEREDRKSVV